MALTSFGFWFHFPITFNGLNIGDIFSII